MAPVSLEVTHFLMTTSLPIPKSQVRFHCLLRSYFLIKKSACRLTRDFFFDGQWLYLRICDDEGRVESCRSMRDQAGWAVRSENWANLQLLPVPLRQFRELFPRPPPTIRPPPKSHHTSVNSATSAVRSPVIRTENNKVQAVVSDQGALPENPVKSPESLRLTLRLVTVFDYSCFLFYQLIGVVGSPDESVSGRRPDICFRVSTKSFDLTYCLPYALSYSYH
ncbi:hypothetical protein V6N12_024009 [Hibiscus sabdariffa]|uniref:Uncharacterized protein n=1 Tax=Hibiscus sabdariffa TaxID=183260 RepID=A0ABR2FZC1_9ROSI